MIYTTINFRHSAPPAESRIVADFLLQAATTKQNVLQMSSPVTITWSTKILRARLEPLGEGLWDLLAEVKTAHGKKPEDV